MSQYATYDDFLVFGVPLATLSGSAFDQPTVERVLRAQSALLDRDLARRHTLPLTSWGDDLRRDTCVLAAYDIMSVIGYPNDQADANFRARYLDVLARHPGIGEEGAELDVDATPGVYEGGPDASSEPLRGW